MTSDSPACSGPTGHFASTTVLRSAPADFVRCTWCGLVMADDITWFADAYASAITKLDVGLLDRCLLLSQVTAAVLRSERLRGAAASTWPAATAP